MGESLKDQLIKAGLVSATKANSSTRPPKSAKPKRKTAARTRHRGDASEEIDLAGAYKARARLERTERAEAERAEREAAARRREKRATIRALLQDARLNDPEASIAYHFAVGDKIKQVYVTREQQELLAEGRLAIVLLDGQRHLVPVETGRRITDIDPSRLVIVHGRDETKTD